jgi:uncharacterized protein YdcH (DUF465 family)
MNNYEQIIWNYLDGHVSVEEKELIELLLKSDTEFMSLFEEINSIHLQISTLELDEPSMSFGRNLMEKIQLEHSPLPQKSLLGKWLINGISLFFLSAILCVLGILFFKIEWSQSSETAWFEFTMPSFALDSSSYSFLINLFVFVDIIVVLYFFDVYISKRIKSKNDHNL